jgi:hypothetical protein
MAGVITRMTASTRNKGKERLKGYRPLLSGGHFRIP